MSERILQPLMQLFAIGAALERETLQSRETVEAFLRQQVSLQRIEEYLALYDDFVNRLGQGADDTKVRKKIAGSSVRMLRICTEINKELNTRQKYIVFLRLAEFMQTSPSGMTAEEKEFLETVASVFTIEAEEYALCISLTAAQLSIRENDSKLVLFASPQKLDNIQNAHQLIHEDVDGVMAFLYLKRAQVILFRYTGQERLTVNGQPADTSRVIVLAQGAVIRGQKILPLYYTDLVRRNFMDDKNEVFHFTVQNLEFAFPNGKKGLHDLNFQIESGSLAGIMGSSGAGKSTLLSVLNGSSRPSSGSVRVNGTNLYEKGGIHEGLVGNIPQDDLLIEELTVFQNLYYNTKLCFGNLDDIEIRRKVDNVLDSLGLNEIKHLRVGNVLNKMISGGQRKRLNIGLELVREPSILFVDEPTSGLSSRDAENVMDLLKQLALSGKLIFVVIHQPSSDIFRMFDLLLMLDTGGYPFYFGNPSDAMIYFKRQVHLTDSELSECPVCGNINPEQLFNIIELHEVDEFGVSTNARRITPVEWNKLYKTSEPVTVTEDKARLTTNNFVRSKPFKQWKIFFTRDFIARIGNKQYMLVNLLEAPALALILGFILRYSNGENYKLLSNPNLPAYLFIGVIVALFLGLSVSAEEIIRDRKIQQREKFLHLNRTSYLMSKVSLLFLLSAIQSLSFVLIGNAIMGIHDMNFVYWLILFSTSCFANLLGLNISAALDSAVTVYILIPFLLIPQILLSGVIVRFEKLHPAITTQEGVPLIGNVMTSRWAYEALAVEQFANNPFGKKFFPADAIMSRATYKKDWWISAMRERLDKCENLLAQHAPQNAFTSPLRILVNGFTEEQKLNPQINFSFLNEFNSGIYSHQSGINARATLDTLREIYIDQYNAASAKKESMIERMTATPLLNESFNNEKNEYENESLEDMVKSNNQTDRLVVTDQKIIQRFEPVYHLKPDEGFFKAPLFSSVKNLGGRFIKTMNANILVIWMMTIILYFTLQINLFRKIISMFGK